MPEMNERPVLSISLLCSGRNIDEAGKCLESIKAIREQIPSEIIIVDTGCGREARALIEDYADRIVDFTWCDDFAAARNAGLDYCSGDWFMFIDDDEWFTDTDELIDFFASGGYKDYDRAQYIIRNFTRTDGSAYSDTWSTRLVRRVEELRFIGKVHEYLAPQGIKEAKIKSMILHYGYAHATPEDMFRKARRNIPLLLEMTLEAPDDGHYPAQLIQEYRNVHDYSSMETLSLSWIRRLYDIDSPAASVLRPDFYEGVMIAELATYDYDGATEHVNEFLSDDRYSEKCRSGLYYYAMQAYWGKKDYFNTFIYAQKYIEDYDRISAEEDVTVDDLTFMCGNIFDLEKIACAICQLIDSGVRCGNIQALHDYFDRFDLANTTKLAIIFCEGVTYALMNYDYDERFSGYVKEMCSHPLLVGLLVKDAQDAEKDEKKGFDRLCQVYAGAGLDSDIYLIYLQILFFRGQHDKEAEEKLYRLIFARVSNFCDMDKKLWDIADEDQIDIGSMISSIPFSRFKKGVDHFFEENICEHRERLGRVISLADKTSGIRSDYLRLKGKELALLEADQKSIAGAMNDFTSQTVNFYIGIYRPEIFTGDTSVLPEDGAFSIEFVKLASSEGAYKPADYIRALMECAELYPELSPAVKKYVEWYGEAKKQALLKQM